MPDIQPSASALSDRELFEKYLEAPLSELEEDDGGRNDKRKTLFLDFGMPKELVFLLWKEIRRQALPAPVSASALIKMMLDTVDDQYGKGSSESKQAHALFVTLPAPVSEPIAFYDGRSKEPCLMWAYDGYVPGSHDVVLGIIPPQTVVAPVSERGKDGLTEEIRRHRNEAYNEGWQDGRASPPQAVVAPVSEPIKTFEQALGAYRGIPYNDARIRCAKAVYDQMVKTPQAVVAQPVDFPYQKTFKAIDAATRIVGNVIAISVKDFAEAFNAAQSPQAKAGDKNA